MRDNFWDILHETQRLNTNGLVHESNKSFLKRVEILKSIICLFSSKDSHSIIAECSQLCKESQRDANRKMGVRRS